MLKEKEKKIVCPFSWLSSLSSLWNSPPSSPAKTQYSSNHYTTDVTVWRENWINIPCRWKQATWSRDEVCDHLFGGGRKTVMMDVFFFGNSWHHTGFQSRPCFLSRLTERRAPSWSRARPLLSTPIASCAVVNGVFLGGTWHTSRLFCTLTHVYSCTCASAHLGWGLPFFYCTAKPPPPSRVMRRSGKCCCNKKTKNKIWTK